jgi:hypothetical protein
MTFAKLLCKLCKLCKIDPVHSLHSAEIYGFWTLFTQLCKLCKAKAVHSKKKTLCFQSCPAVQAMHPLKGVKGALHSAPFPYLWGYAQ